MPKQSIKLQSGQKFNRLTVIRLDHIKEYIESMGGKHNREYYLCKCECGNECIVSKQSILNSHAKSCGCYKQEKSFIHGLSNNKLYKKLINMKSRCYNKNDKRYKDYGGRGITMCEEWKNDFISFYDWSISHGYADNLSIDRIDNNGNYEPSNCRWATDKEQSRNRRSNHLIKYKNEIHCIAEWAEKLNIKQTVLIQRIYTYKWSIEKALTTK